MKHRRHHKIHHTKKGWAADKRKRSSQKWERGKHAKKKGNPRYKPGTCMRKGHRVKCYRLRK